VRVAGGEGRDPLEEAGEDLENMLAGLSRSLSNWCSWWHLSQLETGNSCCPSFLPRYEIIAQFFFSSILDRILELEIFK